VLYSNGFYRLQSLTLFSQDSKKVYPQKGNVKFWAKTQIHTGNSREETDKGLLFISFMTEKMIPRGLVRKGKLICRPKRLSVNLLFVRYFQLLHKSSYNLTIYEIHIQTPSSE